MMERIKEKIQWFVRAWIRPVSLSNLAREDRVIEAGKTLVMVYYALVPLVAYKFMTSGLEDKGNFEALWPLSWTQFVGLEYLEIVISFKLAFVVVSVIAAFFHRYAWVRVLTFLVFMQVHALESSFGYINHQWYAWVYTSCILVFLPNIWKDTSFHVRRKFLLQIWFAQAMLMLLYFMAGVHKFYAVVTQWIAGEIHGLHVMAFAYQSADWIRQLQSPANLAPSIIEHPEWWWLPYVSLYFVQLFALWAMVRVSLQRLWAFALLFFHFGTFFSMGITFSEQFALVIALLVFTPFAPTYLTWRQVFLDLPVVGQVYEYVLRRKGKWMQHTDSVGEHQMKNTP